MVRNVRPWGGDASDVVVVDGAVGAVMPAGSAEAQADTRVIDGAGQVLLPSFSDVHLHLDSNRLGLPFRPHTGAPGRMGSILNDRAHWRSAEKSVADRATYALGLMISRGATRARSHAQVDADTGLEKIEGVFAARNAHAARAAVEIVAFPQVGIHLEKGVVELLDEALALGADLVGGIDPCEIDRDPTRHVDTIFALAEKHQKGIDIHLHERGSLGLFSLDLVAERTRALGMQGHVTVSHAFCLAEATPEVDRAIEEIAELDIALTTIAPAGRLDLPVQRLVDRGVRVGLGMDGQRDYWSPYGNGDMLDRTYQLAFTQGWDTEADLELAAAVATWGGVSVMDATARRVRHADRPGLEPGRPADFVLFSAESVAAGIMDRPVNRTVIHAGAVVASAGELC